MANLAEILYPEMQRIIVLLQNPGNPYLPSSWGWGPIGWTRRLLDDQTCLYEMPGYRNLFIRFENVHPVDTGFTFGHPVEVSSITEDRHTLDRILLEADDSFEYDYSWTFTALESELDAAKQAFETEFSARVGEVYTGPAGAGFKQALTEAYEKQVRKDTTNQETKKYHLAFSGPGGRLVEAVRRTQRQRRHIGDGGHYDYRIVLGHHVEAPLTREVAFANKAELLDVVKGIAGEDKAVYNGRSWAPIYQARPQPSAAIDNVDASVLVSPEHTEVLSQDIIVSVIPYNPPARPETAPDIETPVISNNYLLEAA